MERIKKYRNIILKELSFWKDYYNSDMPNITYQVHTNKAETNFIVLSLGWHNYT